MATGAEAYVTPKMLAWAREQAGYSIADVAAWLKRPLGDLASWESGDAHPSLAQARKLADHYHRPFSDFYLDAVPREALPADFRRHETARNPRIEARLRREIHRLEAFHDAAVELSETTGKDITTFPVTATPRDLISDVAKHLRSALGITHEAQSSWRSSEEAWRSWSRAVEHLGTLIFVISHFEQNDFGGFVLNSDSMPVIGINSKDAPNRKIFTLMHEVVHLALRQAAITDAGDAVGEDSPEVEVFCNAVAAEILMPTAAFLSNPHVSDLRSNRSSGIEDDVLSAIAGVFNVSRQAVYRRLVTLDKASLRTYREWVASQKKRTPSVKGGGGDFYNTYLHHTSGVYLELVFSAYHNRRINLTNVCDYLGTRVEVTQKIEREFVQRTILRGDI
jgi:Zn-dependent peptidase ImmA (M78 family)